MKRVITFGTYDLLHQGHIRLLERAKALGDYLIVGVSTDALNTSKGKESVFNQDQRLAYVKALDCVDEVFFEESLKLKKQYVQTYKADLLVMGDDWQDKFDWVGCETKYLKRTAGVSSTEIKTDIFNKADRRVLLFGDTYVQKHTDCALSMMNYLVSSNIVPILTNTPSLPQGLDCDALVFFNLPSSPLPDEYKDKPKILIDHGASHLKWFLANKARFNFFDLILTAGPDHSRALSTFFDAQNSAQSKSRAVGFIKAEDILSPPKRTRADIAKACNLDPKKPITLFAPTWHISANRDMQAAIKTISGIKNHVASFHPETAHLNTGSLNMVDNINGLTIELMKHADCIISDTSSTIYEAAAMGKPVVQILLREYADNTAILFDFPYTAGTSELFCGGLPARPEAIANAVTSIYKKKDGAREAVTAYQKRILSGTYIDENCGRRMITELRKASHFKTPTTGEAPQDAKLSLAYRKNSFYAANKLIAHGGGDIHMCHASNSREAVLAAIAAVDVVELDFVMGKDGVLVVHDGTEAKHGLDKPFSEVTVKEFLATRHNEKLTPLSLDDAIKLCARPGKSLVCDIKSTGEDYIKIAEKIYKAASHMGVEKHIVIQSYCVDDFTALMNIAPIRSLLAVWKYFYKSPIGPDAFDFIAKCIEINADAVIGISIPYNNKHLRKPSVEHKHFKQLFAFWKRVYIHGAPKGKYAEILQQNIGLFADGFDWNNHFKHKPKEFRWIDYLFLYPGLIDAGCDTQTAATVHYNQYGKKEGRLPAYELPKDFLAARYRQVNPNLAKGGISEANSAKAHYTRYGAQEGRPYT